MHGPQSPNNLASLPCVLVW